MATESTEGLAVLGYLGVVARWKWLIVGILGACLVAGVAYLATTTPLYRATARLLYIRPVAISNSLVQGSLLQAYEQPDIGTISAIVSSDEVSGAAAELLSDEDTSAGYWVSATLPVDTTGQSSATVVGIDAVSSDPQTAAGAANAHAEAFVEWRRETARAQVSDALTAVKAALQSYTTAEAKETAEYLQLRQAQQALELQLESLTGDFAVITPATPPEEPFSPRVRHTLALAVMLGLALSLGLTFLLEQLDTRVRDEQQMNELLGMSALGHLPALTKRPGKKPRAQMLADPTGPMAEAVRVLRSNLSFAGVDGDVRKLVVTSSIRTEGKTVTACNLAVSMALAGQRVVLVDADFRRPRVHVYMDVPNSKGGLSSVLVRRTEMPDALMPVALGDAVSGSPDGVESPESQPRETAVRVMTMTSGGRVGDRGARYSWAESEPPARPEDDLVLRVLPSGPLPPNPGEMAASRRFGEIIDELAATADLVIIDTPPLLEVGDAGAIAARADGVLFVVNMGKVRWPMLERSHAQLMKFTCRKLGSVVIAAKKVRRPAYGYEYRATPNQNDDAPPSLT